MPTPSDKVYNAKERARAAVRKYHASHREEKNAYSRKYYKANREKILAQKVEILLAAIEYLSVARNKD